MVDRRLTRAITRAPAANFAEGQTTVDLGAPIYELALEQHHAYCQALESCGITLTHLQPDNRYPDSTFVEDTAVLTRHCAIVTRPGATSRAGEVVEIGPVLDQFHSRLLFIRSPGTVDGGDVCEAGARYFIGLSERTNEAGARQLAELLVSFGYTVSLIDIRHLNGILHLKSGISCLGDNRLVTIESLADLPEFSGFDLVRVNPGSEYAANCVRVNDHVVVAAGFPEFEAQLQDLGYQTIALDMSEFQKMDGGLSCLSLRW